jgi:CubicO group peptidase (beta-lactamase class C family)
MTSQTQSPVSGGTRPPGPYAPAFRLLEEAIAARAFPGCSFGVLAGGETVLEGALGRFTYEPGAPAVMAGTVYDLASVTKVVATTATAMLLVQRGKLDLEMLLGELLPDFVADRPNSDPARRVRLRHLLAHSSGLPGYVKMFRTAATPEALMQECFALKIEAEPGARAEYSDPGFILLGKALEVLTGERLDSWARREIFEPLGMHETGFRQPQATRALIPPTEEDTSFRHRRIQGEVQDENAFVLGGVAGHAGLFSNVADLLRFAREVLAGATGRAGVTESIFDRATIEKFAQRQGPEGNSVALGWDTPSEISSSGRHFSPHTIGHLGYSGCSLWIDLDASIAVILLTNRTWPDRSAETDRLIRKVRPAFHNAIREALSNPL